MESKGEKKSLTEFLMFSHDALIQKVSKELHFILSIGLFEAFEKMTPGNRSYLCMGNFYNWSLMQRCTQTMIFSALLIWYHKLHDKQFDQEENLKDITVVLSPESTPLDCWEFCSTSYSEVLKFWRESLKPISKLCNLAFAGHVLLFSAKVKKLSYMTTCNFIAETIGQGPTPLMMANAMLAKDHLKAKTNRLKTYRKQWGRRFFQSTCMTVLLNSINNSSFEILKTD